MKEAIAKRRERLKVPADPARVATLAARYHSAALGDLAIRQERGGTTFDVGEWASTVASRENDDGTISFVTIDPTLGGFEFVVAEREGRRALIVRDGQHEYVFRETGLITPHTGS